MLKRDIVKKLKSYGINATLRPRKSTLEELLKRVEKDRKKGKYPLYEDLRGEYDEEIITEWDGPKGWNHDSKQLDIAVLEEMLDPKKSDNQFDFKWLATILVLVVCGMALLPW